MKIKIFNGLFGVSSSGTLKTPKGKKIIKLPSRIAFKIHKFLNSLAYVGLRGTYYIGGDKYK